MTKGRWLEPIVVFTLLFALTCGYLWPGPRFLFGASVTRVMGNDGDPSAWTFGSAALIKSFAEDPARFFYGAVYLDNGNPAHGVASWVPWFERWFIVAVRSWVPLEQISTAFVMTILLLSALAMYGFARLLRWPAPVSFALAVAWAFNPFTRLRADGHFAMAGVYHLPLIFIGLELCARRRGARSILLATICFLIACTTFAYLVIVAAALFPAYLVYLKLRARDDFGRALRRALLASVPAVIFMGWNVAAPIPGSIGLSPAELFPRAAETETPGRLDSHLKTDAARPLDYLGGDLALAGPDRDWLAPRRLVNAHTLARVGTGSLAERTNGIRWGLIALALVALGSARGPERRLVWFFAAFALMCFWLSLPPDRPFFNAGPSGWLWRMVHQMRVPARAGIGVHFGVLGIVGVFLSHRRTRNWRAFAWALPLLVLLDYPPFRGNMATAEIRPKFEHLRPGTACGLGLLYPPFVGEEAGHLNYYHFKQRLRESECSFLNALTDPGAVASLRRRFPRPHEDAPDRATTHARVARLARCVPLSWIAFDETTPEDERKALCDKLGWDLFDEGSCVSRRAIERPRVVTPETCPI